MQLLRAYAMDEWEVVQKEIQELGTILKQRRDYVRWADRSAERWQDLIEMCRHPLVVKLVQFLLRQKRVMFLVDVADVLSDHHQYVVIEHASEKPPTQMASIEKQITQLWGGGVPIRTERQPDLIEGVCLTYGRQTFDTSYRQYRHNLITSLRRASIQGN